MRVEYIFLLILSLLPLIYKIWYWQQIFLEQKKWDIDFWKYLLRKQGRASYTHFWTMLEFLIMLAWILPIIDKNFEYLWYPMFFYFLIIYNIYVLWKILRKKIFLPQADIMFLCITLLSMILLSLSIVFSQSIYFLISMTLLFIPIKILLIQKIFSVVNIRK